MTSVVIDNSDLIDISVLLVCRGIQLRNKRITIKRRIYINSEIRKILAQKSHFSHFIFSAAQPGKIGQRILSNYLKLHMKRLLHKVHSPFAPRKPHIIHTHLSNSTTALVETQ